MESKTLVEILDYLCDELGGDWFLTGGALVRLSFDAQRGTEDMDLMRIRHSELSDEAAKTLLFKWLIARGLGPEWVNSAVEPFVREVPEWQNELVMIRKGSKGRLFRPNLTLFTYLKLRRGTPVDLSDIKVAATKCAEGFNEDKFLRWADGTLKCKFDKFRGQLGL